jgi:hypothetical protein
MGWTAFFENYKLIYLENNIKIRRSVRLEVCAAENYTLPVLPGTTFLNIILELYKLLADSRGREV